MVDGPEMVTLCCTRAFPAMAREASAALTHCPPVHNQATTRTVLIPSPGIAVFTESPLSPKTFPLRLHTNP